MYIRTASYSMKNFVLWYARLLFLYSNFLGTYKLDTLVSNKFVATAAPVLPLPLWFLGGRKPVWFVFVHSDLAQITGRPQKSLITHLDSDSTCKNKNIHPKATFSFSLLCLEHQSCCCCFVVIVCVSLSYYMPPGSQLGLCSSPVTSLGGLQHY